MNRWGATSFACLAASAMCLLALAQLPYGYYMLLRLVVCGVAALVGLRLMVGGRGRWSLIAWGLVILYNPFFRVRLERDVWAGINVATSAAMLVGAWACRVPKSAVAIEAARDEVDERDDDFHEDDDDQDESPPAPTPETGIAVPPAPVDDQYSDLIRMATDRLRARAEAAAAEEEALRKAAYVQSQAKALQAKLDAIGDRKEKPK